MARLLLKAIGVWMLILALAIGNAGVREVLLTPAIGAGIALPISGLLLSVIVVVVAWSSIPFFGSKENRDYMRVGLTWFVLTLSFEFLLGRFVAGKTWLEIVQVLDVTEGNLFVVALLATLTAPWLSAKARGVI